jgi:hypothetical protein
LWTKLHLDRNRVFWNYAVGIIQPTTPRAFIRWSPTLYNLSNWQRVKLHAFTLSRRTEWLPVLTAGVVVGSSQRVVQ